MQKFPEAPHKKLERRIPGKRTVPAQKKKFALNSAVSYRLKGRFSNWLLAR